MFIALTDKAWFHYTVRISPRLREEWHNGRRYYQYDGRPLVQLPSSAMENPSKAALEWHIERVFLG